MHTNANQKKAIHSKYKYTVKECLGNSPNVFAAWKLKNVEALKITYSLVNSSVHRSEAQVC